MKAMLLSSQAIAKGSILTQKSVTRVYCVAAAFHGDAEDVLDIQVCSNGGPIFANEICAIGLIAMLRVNVFF